VAIALTAFGRPHPGLAQQLGIFERFVFSFLRGFKKVNLHFSEFTALNN
jgi:hypothetical protein